MFNIFFIIAVLTTVMNRFANIAFWLEDVLIKYLVYPKLLGYFFLAFHCGYIIHKNSPLFTYLYVELPLVL